jgi:hypothetical protein
MDDAIIDTNVIIVASLAMGGRADESHRTAQECAQVFEWLDAFRTSNASLVLDNGLKILDEYRNKLNDQDYGMIVAMDKLKSWQCRLHEIEHETTADEAAIVPAAFANLDRSDRKFLAVALADRAAGHTSEIVNATDTDDWRAIEDAATEHGVVIHHLLDD